MAHRPPDSLAISSDLSDAGSGVVVQESYREIKCCFSVTIRRDAWGVPVAIMGQWIVRCLYPDPTVAADLDSRYDRLSACRQPALALCAWSWLYRCLFNLYQQHHYQYQCDAYYYV